MDKEELKYGRKSNFDTGKRQKNQQDQFLSRKKNYRQNQIESFPSSKKKQIMEQDSPEFSQMIREQGNEESQQAQKKNQNQTMNKLFKIINKYLLEDHQKNQILEFFYKGNLQKCKDYVKRRQRSTLFAELSELKNQENNIFEIESSLQWAQQLRQVMKNYDISQEDEQVQFRNTFCTGKFEYCLDFVKKSQRPGLKLELDRIYNSFKKTNKKKSWKEQLFIINEKYQISQNQVKQFQNNFRQGNMSECCQYVQRKKRESLKKQINLLYFEYLSEQIKSTEWKDNFFELLDKLQVNQQKKMEYIEAIIENDEEKLNSQKFFKIQISFIVKEFVDIKKKVARQFLKDYLFLYLLKKNLCQNQCKDLVQLIISGQMQALILPPEIQIQEFNEFIISHDKWNFSKLKKQTIQFTIQFSENEQKKHQKIEFSEKNILDFFASEYPLFDFQTHILKFQNKQILNFEELLSQIQGKKRAFLIIEKKNELNYQYDQQIFKIYTKKNLKINQADILQMITKDMNRIFNLGITSQSLILNFVFLNKVMGIISNLKDAEVKNGSLQKILVDLNIKVRVYFNGEEKIFQMATSQTVHDLKTYLEKDLIPKQAQSLSCLRENQDFLLKEKDEQQKLLQYMNGDLVAEFYLKDFHTNEYYGFHENYPLTHEKFSEFFIEDEEKNQQIIRNSDFERKQLENLFFQNFINHLFGSIKKRFPIQVVLNKFKQMVAKIKYKNIWSPSQQGLPIKMNQHFVFMYLLHNSDKKLKIQLMSLVKSKIPLPLYLPKFSNIFNVSKQLTFNEEIFWCYKKGINVISIGLHNNKQLMNQTGKTFLLNHLFFTNFPLKEVKHNIIKKVPYISLSVFDDLFPLNVIDVPSDCDEQIQQHLMEIADIIFISSWKSESQTKKYQRKISDKYNVATISFIRDIKGIIKQQLQIIKTANIINGQPLKIINLSKIQLYKSIVDLLREKINQILKKNKSSKEIHSLVNKEKQIVKFSQSLKVFESQNEHICFFTKETQDKNKEETKNVRKSLHQNIQLIVEMIASSQINRGILLKFFMDKIRILQRETISHYMQIYKLKQQYKSLSNLNDHSSLKQIDSRIKQIKNLSISSKSILNKSEEQTLQIFEDISYQFENKIKPYIFSSELFWRELVAFNKYDKYARVSNRLLYDLIVQLKSFQIMSNQPFQIIDGDNLQMSKNLMKDVFKCLNERCLVISIIGPQSSGKSTLLNFLFGCDFATSEGRCTRGVYGTFFRFNDQFMANFDGIFVIDTEGLFSVTNQADSQHLDRQDFDSKLVLFCLAVSDFVIINVKGNIDNHTEKILRICYEKLESLNLSEDSRPQIVIVLNQNNTSRTQQSQNEFKKIKKTLDFKIQRSLPLAYKIDNYTHQQISILAENQILSKKNPEIHFLKETSKLLQSLIERMKIKRGAQKIIDKIDKFYEIWSTVLAFPSLSQLTTKQYLEYQYKIKQWKKNREEQLNAKTEKLLQKVKFERIKQNLAFEKLQQMGLNYLSDFQYAFKSQNLSQDLRILVEKEEKQIHLKNQNSSIKMRYHLMQINLKKQMNREKFEGQCFLREKQREIIKNQSQNFRNYSENQKIQIFNACFEESVKKLEKTVNLNQSQSNQYARIEADYSFLLKSSKSSMKGLCLPKQKIKIPLQDFMDLKIEEVQSLLLQEIVDKTFDEDTDHFMTFANEKYTNVLKGSLSDAKLKYFNARQYFYQEKKTQQFFISRSNLCECINFEKIFERAYQQNQNQKSEAEERCLLSIYNKINKVLQYYGLKIYSFWDFHKIYEYYRSFLFYHPYLSIFNPQIPVYSIVKIFKNKHNQKMWEKGLNREYIQIKKNQIYKSDNGKQEYHHQKHLCSNIFYSIKWKYIKYQAQKVSQKQRRQILVFLSLLKEDLLRLNLSIQINHEQIQKIFDTRVKYYEPHIKKLERLTFQNVQTADNERLFDDFYTFLQQLPFLKYINTKKFQETIKQANHDRKKCHFYDDMLFIGKQQIKFLKEKRPEFQGYLDNDYRNMNQRFKQENFRKFALQQIENNKSIQHFIGVIFKIIRNIKQKWGSFENKGISQLYNKVNQEISLFNNDLNQISYKLHTIFIGRIHLLVTHMIWKYEIESLKQKQNEPLNTKKKNRQHQLSKFLLRTSNNLNSIINQEVQSFHQQVLKAFEHNINDIKKKEMQKHQTIFFQNNKRSNIQQQIDMQVFAKHSGKQVILRYLQKPAQIIEQKYQQKYEKTWDDMVYTFEKNKFSEQFHKDIMTSIQRILEYLQNEKVSEQHGSPNDLFQIIGVANNLDYDEDAKVTLLYYFFDILLDNEPDKIRNCSDVQLSPKLKLRNTTQLSEFSKKVIQKVNPVLLKITNLPKFLKKNLIQVNQKQLKNSLAKAFSFKDQEKKQFINSIRVVVCKETCPCCRRICGEENDHSFHQCLYGHQMRALAGNYIKKPNGKKEAFVARCEQLSQTDIMQFNGNKMTWTQFKKYWSSKETGGWIFNDANDNFYPQNKKRFQSAWIRAGNIFCLEKGIEFVPFNEAQNQIQSFNQKAHFIFALDDSGSMSGSCWNDLMKAVGETVNKIKQYDKNGSQVKISILNFSSDTHLYYERCSPNQIDIGSIHYRGSGTQFQQPFQLAYNIAQKTIHSEVITFIFMTDGGANYPQRGIKKFQQLSRNYPKSFIYSGIQFSSNSSVMKNICSALNGKNIIASNFEQLLQAYMSCVEIIAYQEKKQVYQMK